MKKILLFFFLFPILINVKGQNLVPNGDFEQYSGCPTGYSQLSLALSWMNPATGDADYYNQCSTSPSVTVPDNTPGYQNGHSGVAYVGLYLKWSIQNFREYIEAPLTSPLIANNCYLFEMYVSAADAYAFSTDKIGIYFSPVAITGVINYYPLPYTPQINNVAGNYPDSLNWILISGTYTAAGGETHLLIGNFLDDSNTNTITFNAGGYPGAYLYIDDVSLTPCTGIEEENQNDALKIYPNPVKDELKVSGLKFKTDEKAEVKIFNVLGKEIYRRQFNIQHSTFNISKTEFILLRSMMEKIF